MAQRSTNTCVVPHCGRHIIPEKGDDYPQGCISRQLCGRCYGSRAYWRRREDENPGAGAERRRRLSFFTSRLGWLFDNGGLKE